MLESDLRQPHPFEGRRATTIILAEQISDKTDHSSPAKRITAPENHRTDVSRAERDFEADRLFSQT